MRLVHSATVSVVCNTARGFPRISINPVAPGQHDRTMAGAAIAKRQHGHQVPGEARRGRVESRVDGDGPSASMAARASRSVDCAISHAIPARRGFRTLVSQMSQVDLPYGYAAGSVAGNRVQALEDLRR